MNKKLAIALLSVGLLSANAARADDALLGALLGGGAGVLIGHSVGGRNGAVIAIASERQQPRVAYYMPPPVYVSQPVYMAPVVMETVPVRYERERWAHRHWQHYRD
jgi:hypothetical protein